MSEKYFNKWEEEAKIGCVWNKIHRCSIQIYVCNLLNFTYLGIHIPFCLLVFFSVMEGWREKPEILLKINHFYPIKYSVTELFYLKAFNILKLIQIHFSSKHLPIRVYRTIKCKQSYPIKFMYNFVINLNFMSDQQTLINIY